LQVWFDGELPDSCYTVIFIPALSKRCFLRPKDDGPHHAVRYESDVAMGSIDSPYSYFFRLIGRREVQAHLGESRICAMQ
jgi:hypothetical protein